jgi:tetratricopeptide (TPR) repeat protein
MKRNPREQENKIQRTVRSGLLILSLIAACILLIQPIQRNLAFSQGLKAIVVQPGNYDRAFSLLTPIIGEDCRVNWQIILLTNGKEKPEEVEPYINNLFVCSPESVDLLLSIFPAQIELANRASQLYPEEPKAWFWLGDLANQSGDILQAKEYFEESVNLDPAYALAWCRLGSINEQQSLLADAEEAFWQCCQNGDPGSNGCYGAGRMAEKLNDIPAAIKFYNHSHWLPALQRADELEASR